MPDLKIEAVETTLDCKVKISVKNLGAKLQDALYSSNPVILRINDQRGFKCFARFTLSQVDSQGKLKGSRGQVFLLGRSPKVNCQSIRFSSSLWIPREK